MSTEVSERYLGEQGVAYGAARQPDPDDPGYLIDFQYFKPYLRPEQVVLDFGCGNGGILRQAQTHVAKVEGVEVNPASREIARRAGAVVHESIEAIPPGSRYDVIFSNHVLEHVRDVCRTLEALRPLLAPGGRLLLKLPFDDANSAYQKTWSAADIDHHLYTWTPRVLANLLMETGYRVESCRLITAAWHPRLFWLSRLGLADLAFWALAVIKRRRQTFAVAVNAD